MFLKLVVGLLLSYSAWSLVALERNYRRAASMGIPLVRLPIDPLNVFFQVSESHVWTLLESLPFKPPLPGWARYARRGWNFKDKASSHLEYGPIWALVTPADIHVFVCDPEAVHDVFARRNDFIRPNKMYKILEVYGPAIPSADQANWPRHRKVLATPFNEAAMSFVWTESLRQARGLIDFWVAKSSTPAGFSSMAKDTRTVSLNVMAACGFRRSFDFKDSSQEEQEMGRYSYRNALQIVLDNVILLLLIPQEYLRCSWLPQKLQKLGKAAADFKFHMAKMLEEETESMNRGEQGSGSLMTSFVRALDTNNRDGATSAGTKGGLSVDEIFGNIFVINFAGHDTTANTLAFSMLYLAAYPEVQRWAGEEVRRVTKGKTPAEWDYNVLYPQLRRCHAILLETLRLHPPIMSLPKWTTDRPEPLKVGNRTIVIPPFSGVNTSVLASHTHPDHWADPLLWKPSRWITPAPDNEEMESEMRPPRGVFYPWSDGPQICLGVKFSQVEFVAVIACLLHSHRLSVVPDESKPKSGDQVTKRVLGVTEDCDLQILLRMKNPERIRLQCHTVEAGDL